MIDTHAHLQDEKFNNVEQIIQNAHMAGVTQIVCASSSLKTSQMALKIANDHSNVFATVGIHPEEAGEFDQNAKQKLAKLAQNKKVVAIGEIGLDYHYEFCSREQQKFAFCEQIKLANELKLPVVVHTRDATAHTLEILKDNLSLLTHGVVIHCYSMGVEVLKQVQKWGFYISLGGAITFKNAKQLLDVVKQADINRVMLETDCPYMSPEPYRGQINEPKNVEFVAKKIAEVKGLTYQQVVKITTQNAQKFFNLNT